MCGIFGFVTTKQFTYQRGLYAAMAHAAEMRGKESFGVVFGDLEGNLKIVKGIGRITTDTELVNQVANARIVMAHTRLATTGKVTLDNTHPYDYNDHLVSHNGMIYNYEELQKLDGKIYTVDSQALAWRIAHGKNVDDCEGYGAVSWITPEGHLHVGRMNRGDLDMFRVLDPVSGAYAHCYISDAQGGAFGTSFITAIQRLGMVPSKVREPEEASTFRITTRGFTPKPRKLELKASNLYHDWRSGTSWSSGGGSKRQKAPGSSKLFEIENSDGVIVDLRPLKPCMLRGYIEDYHGAWLEGFGAGETDVNLMVWKFYHINKNLYKGLRLQGTILTFDSELTEGVEHELGINDQLVFYSPYNSRYMLDADDVSHLINDTDFSPMEIDGASVTVNSPQNDTNNIYGTFEVVITDLAQFKAWLSKYIGHNA